MKRSILVFFLSGICFAQQPPAAPELTIASIYAENGITGREPDTINWSPDGKKVSYVVHEEQGEKADLYYIDVATGKPAVLVASQKIAAMKPPVSTSKDDREKDNRARYHVAGYHWAPDSQHILFDANGQLWYYTLATGTAVALTSSTDAASDPKFSPDGKHLSYIRKHNLYVRPVAGGPEKTLTHDSDENLLDGEVDWVYAEELDVRSNYYWSPNGGKIVLLQMNETKVPTYPITDFIPQHPTVSQEKYPKVGDPNPVVRLGIVGSGGGHPKWIHLSDNADTYIPRFGWINDRFAWAMLLNRAQNQLDLYFIDADSGKSRRVLNETSDTWIEIDDNFSILGSGDKFIWSSWRDGHTHLYLYSFDKNDPLAGDAKLVNQITKGDFEVFSVDGVDEKSGTLFVTSNTGDARQRQIYSVKLDGSNFQPVTKEEGTHEAKFSGDAKFYVDNFSAQMTPPQLSFCQTGGSCSVFWKSRSIDPYKLVPPQFVDFKAEDGTVLHGLIFLPPESEGKKIPLINSPYGGPHGQSVRNAWGGAGMLFNQILMRDGIAVLVVDNRGMGARGKQFAAALRHDFGDVELKDQLAAIDQALQKFAQLDGTRLGWWGWSYGGYMTLTAMTHSDRFKAGIAVAPVTDWHDYDSIYTERYEGLVPADEAAYHKSSPVTFAARLHGDLLEVHGTSDDNVHIQNTMQMVDALINAGKQFDLLVYPRKTHGISGPQARTHLFTRIREHFNRELLGKTPQALANPPMRIKVAPQMADGNVVHRVEPVLPEPPGFMHAEGTVILDAVIDEHGKVQELKAISGHPLLIASAIDAVRRWQYKPFLLNGESVEVETTVTVQFHQ